MEINLQLFGGRGTSSGGSYSFSGHKMPEKWKPNSSITRYDSSGKKREKRKFDSNGDKQEDTHYMGPPNHKYPHKHYWWRDENGQWQRSTYDDWVKGRK